MAQDRDQRGRKDQLRTLATAGGLGMVAATVVNAAIFGIGRAADISYVVGEGADEQDLGVGAIVGVTVLTFAVGLVAAAIAVAARRPSLRVGQIIGGGLAVATIYNSFAVEASGGASTTLALMHLVSGAAYVASLQAVRDRAEPRPAQSRGPAAAAADQVGAAHAG